MTSQTETEIVSEIIASKERISETEKLPETEFLEVLTETEHLLASEKNKKVLVESMEQLETDQNELKIAPIMFFDMNKPEQVTYEFISKDPLKFGHTTFTNDELINELTSKGYKLVSTEKQGTIVYGIFQKI